MTALYSDSGQTSDTKVGVYSFSVLTLTSGKTEWRTTWQTLFLLRHFTKICKFFTMVIRFNQLFGGPLQNAIALSLSNYLSNKVVNVMVINFKTESFVSLQDFDQ